VLRQRRTVGSVRSRGALCVWPSADPSTPQISEGSPALSRNRLCFLQSVIVRCMYSVVHTLFAGEFHLLGCHSEHFADLCCPYTVYDSLILCIVSSRDWYGLTHVLPSSTSRIATLIVSENRGTTSPPGNCLLRISRIDVSVFEASKS